ncbi:MAG: hypothetical protein H0W61_03290 [Bacteroidetes bacterium]|nr:hypothetical protein [Bacteroidota bacterium]
MIPSREILLRGFVFEPGKIDWSFYRNKFTGISDAAVFIMESSIQKHEYIKNAILQIKQRKLIRKIDKILK